VKRKPIVGISAGDPSGIGPEIIRRALLDARVRKALVPVVYGDASLSLERGLVPVTALVAAERKAGKPSAAGGRAQLRYIRRAVAAAQAGELDALCTAPVSKEQISRSGERFMGHTELLAEAFERNVLMMMDGPRVRVALATNHLALKDVPGALSVGSLTAQLLLLSTSLRGIVGRSPRIAVCGLNPHTGEGGLLGREEVHTITPAIRRARQKGVRCEGPFAADGLFGRIDHAPFDAVLAMYHDQGLVAAKALDFDNTVNVTLGLPLPRTSPDHGVAYDIAGEGKASAEPMVQALLKAAALVSPGWDDERHPLDRGRQPHPSKTTQSR
jgi:4-hydroxythreonine-4-phosphate dehydrogenase